MSFDENRQDFDQEIEENTSETENPPQDTEENAHFEIGQTIETEEGTFIYAGLYPPEESPLSAEKKPVKLTKSFAVYVAMLCFFCSLLAGAFGLFIGLKMANTSLTLDAMIDRMQANADKGVTGNTIAEVAPSVAKCGVTVQVSEDNANIAGISSGVCIAQEGSSTYIACCYHAIAGYPYIRVKDDSGNLYTASLVGYDYMTDLAVLKISATGLKIAVPTAGAPSVGQTAIIVGSPLGNTGNCVSVGFVSRQSCEVVLNGITASTMKLDAALNPGNSGGGVFDTNGHLFGIVCAKVSESDGVTMEGLGFAIPASAAYPIFDAIIDRGFAPNRADLGIVFKAPTSQSDGLVIDSYLYESELADGDVLLEGDVIVSLKQMATVTSINLEVADEQSHGEAMMKLNKALSNLEEGSTVTLEIEREGSYASVWVQIKVKKTQ
ncbi:MAG: serine protease [Clostridia bacterium]|nr:serine protease [Clostridia bacterium]